MSEPRLTLNDLRVAGKKRSDHRERSRITIADLTCPAHGVNGTEPGDGPWETMGKKPWLTCLTCGGTGTEPTHKEGCADE